MKRIIVAIIFLSSQLMILSTVDAAVNSLSGGISLGSNYDSNVHRTPDNETDEWETTVSAFISLNRKNEMGGLSFRYSPTFKYNHRTEKTSWGDQRLNFNGWKNISEHLRANLSNIFTKTDDLWGDYLSSTATGLSEQQVDQTVGKTTEENTAQAATTLSDKIARQKYWTNSLSTSFDYEYARNSTVTLGFNNRILKYDESDMNNYKYNEPWINLSYWFGPQWNSSLSYTYTNAQFDISEDSTAHDAGVTLNYVHSVQDSFFGGLKYYQKNYDTPAPPALPSDQVDYYTIRANLGWTHAFSPQKILSMSTGPGYVKKDNENNDNYTTAYFDINYRNSFENGSWFVQATGGYEDRSFEGANEGLSEYRQIGTGVSWQAAKNLSAGLGANVRKDDFRENPLQSDEKTYSGNASLSYRFSRWFYVSGRYVYTQVDADINDDDYVDHRFFITLGASKELYRW